MLEVKVGQTTHAGRVRQENQDKIGIIDCSIGYAFILADGMGGHRGGATAATLVVKSIQSDLGKAQPGADVATVVTEAIQTANLTVHRQSSGGDADLKGMGSTVVVAVINDDSLLVAHVGDSRAYHIRGGVLKRITRDHTIVQGLVDAGFLTEKQAREHPNASVLSRAMGHGENVDVEVDKPVPLEPGDMILLCSDGLSSYVSEAEIRETLLPPGAPVQDIADQLRELALNAGGRDNVSIFCLRMESAKPAAIAVPAAVAGETARPKTNRRWLGIAATVAVLSSLAGYQWWSDKHAAATAAAPVAAVAPAAVPEAAPTAAAPAAVPQPTATVPPPVAKAAPATKPPVTEATAKTGSKAANRLIVMYYDNGPTERRASAIVKKLREEYSSIKVLPIARKNMDNSPNKVTVYYGSTPFADAAGVIAESLNASAPVDKNDWEVVEEYRPDDVVIVVPKRAK